MPALSASPKTDTPFAPSTLLAKAIRKAMRENGFTLTKLADEMGVTVSTASSFVDGSQITDSTAERIASILGIRFQEITFSKRDAK